MQQSTMSEITHHHDNKEGDPFNYSHDTCPTWCQDQLIVELDVEGCDNRIFCKCCDLGCLECQWWWDEVEELVEKLLEGESIISRLRMKTLWLKSPPPSLQVFNQSLLWTFRKRCSDGNFWLLFEGGSIPIEKHC